MLVSGLNILCYNLSLQTIVSRSRVKCLFFDVLTGKRGYKTKVQTTKWVTVRRVFCYKSKRYIYSYRFATIIWTRQQRTICSWYIKYRINSQVKEIG